MADSLSVSTAVAALVANATKSTIVCRSLLTTYADAPETLVSINIDASIVKSTLSSIYSSISFDTNGLANELRSGKPLSNALNAVLSAATITLGDLDNALHRLLRESEARYSGFWDEKIRSWDEGSMRSMGERLKKLRTASSIILEAVEMTDSEAIPAFLHARGADFERLKSLPAITSPSPVSASGSFSMFASVDEEQQEEEDADISFINSHEAVLGRSVLSQLRISNKFNRWAGSEDSMSTPSLMSDAGEPFSEASSPSTPKSRSSERQLGTESPSTASERSWPDRLQLHKRAISAPQPQIPRYDSNSPSLISIPYDSYWSSIHPASSFEHTPKSEALSPPSLPPKSPRRKTLMGSPSYATLRPPTAPSTPSERKTLMASPSYAVLRAPTLPEMSTERKTLMASRSTMTLRTPTALITPPERNTLRTSPSHMTLRTRMAPSTPSEPSERASPLSPTTSSTSSYSIPKSEEISQPINPTYTFTPTPSKTPSPSPEQSPLKTLFRRKSIANLFNRRSSSFNLLQQTSSPLTPKPTSTSTSTDKFSITWLSTTRPATCQPRHQPRKQPLHHNHPIYSTTTLTIPLISDASVPTQSLLKNYAAHKSANLESHTNSKTETFDTTISGSVSDGTGQTPNRVDATFAHISRRKGVEMLTTRRYSDAPFAILCFNIVDTSTLESVIGTWAPLLRTTLPTTPLIMLGLGGTNNTPMVSRSRALAAAKKCGAEAYVECSQDSAGDLEALVGFLIGVGASGWVG